MDTPSGFQNDLNPIKFLIGNTINDGGKSQFTDNGLVLVDPSNEPELLKISSPMGSRFPSISNEVLYVNASAPNGHFGYIYNYLLAGMNPPESILITTLDVIKRHAPKLESRLRNECLKLGENCDSYPPVPGVLQTLLDDHISRPRLLRESLEKAGFSGKVTLKPCGSTVGLVLIEGNGSSVIVGNPSRDTQRLADGVRLNQQGLTLVRRYWSGVDETVEVPCADD